MRVLLDNADERPIYVQIMDEIRRGVVLGTLRPEDTLPSVRQLAVELRVNPNTVAQAYRELEREGVVYVRRGQGTFIAALQQNGDERRALLGGVAERAVREAHRHGADAEELIAAIRAAAERTNTPAEES
jgi:GntR family transcriptional regulator